MHVPFSKQMKIKNSYFSLISLLTIIIFSGSVHAENDWLKPYNVVWNSQSKNSGESMPCGGGDIGLNVWVENGELLMYHSRSGAFDELNGFPKTGRIRIKLTPNPFEEGSTFRQELKLREGFVRITGEKESLKAAINIWVDVFRPVVHIDVESNHKLTINVISENWRLEDHELPNKEKEACRSWLGTSAKAIRQKDNVCFTQDDAIIFYHQNRNTETAFDLVTDQQGLNAVKDKMFNPIKNLIFGGLVWGKNMKPDGITTGKYASTPYQGWKLTSIKPEKKQRIELILHIDSAKNVTSWETGLADILSDAKANNWNARKNTLSWWNSFWDRSYMRVDENKTDPNSTKWQIGRNYQVFRYQLGCNAYGSYPTKFNGGLFTYDPEYVDTTRKLSPDFRRWGGGSFTAQNQRLVYWPMLKNGDFDMMKPQLDFYLRTLRNAEIRTEQYWGHKGAAFSEQIENFALPIAYEYGWNRPADFEPGLEYNPWVEYQWDTVFEFCLMMLDLERFNGNDISEYIPLIESCLTFYDEHYQKLAEERTGKKLDENGHLIIYPGTACETYKMANNPVTTISALTTVLTRLLELDSSYLSEEKRDHCKEMLNRIPPISFREQEGHKTISPAKSWERINNTEMPQLYPVYPYGIYGIGKPDLDIAINTWKYGADRPDQKGIQSWHQDAIFCARLGLTEEAANLTIQKMKDSERRFPTFWGPGKDWTPDHNWGGTGLIGMQEMLMQTDGMKIYLFPAWPSDWNVNFKLHAPYNTIVEGCLENGTIKTLKVTPESRLKDIHIMLR